MVSFFPTIRMASSRTLWYFQMHMQKNNSPWLDQINRTRPVTALDRDAVTDIVIVGAGIAGVATAYFILHNTDKRVIVLEASMVAHGATGHNAGQLVSYFERPFDEIIKEFGKDKAVAGLASVESAWHLLERIYAETGIETPIAQFTGYAGCTSIKQVLRHLKNDTYRIEAGLPRGPVVVNEEVMAQKLIPSEYDGMYISASAAEVLNLLETDDIRYIAALGSRKGCLNSARFTEELFTHLLKKYPDRFDLFENTAVRTVRLHKDNAEILSAEHVVTADRVILCTNGFEYLKIENKHGADINTEFHHIVKGSVGYMAAYRDGGSRPPVATSYFPIESSDVAADTLDATPYYYLTRRLHYTGTEAEPGLICIGGPEKRVDDTTAYSRHHSFPEEARTGINAFLRASYRHTPEGDIPHAFLWHGLMGYTPNGIRRVGPEPRNPVLLYNLGCNGVGILPSIFGGDHIAKIVNGDALPSSIFDVPE